MKLKVTFDGNSDELETRRKREKNRLIIETTGSWKHGENRENKQLTETRRSWKHGEKGKVNS